MLFNSRTIVALQHAAAGRVRRADAGGCDAVGLFHLHLTLQAHAQQQVQQMQVCVVAYGIERLFLKLLVLEV